MFLRQNKCRKMFLKRNIPAIIAIGAFFYYFCNGFARVRFLTALPGRPTGRTTFQRAFSPELTEHNTEKPIWNAK